jgi:hypothetical protein
MVTNNLNYRTLKFARANHPDDFSTLWVKQTDLKRNVVSALSWICSINLDFTLNKFETGPGGAAVLLEPTGDPAEISSIPGRFTEDISASDITQMCNDYELLYRYYKEYKTLTSPEFDPQLSKVLFNIMIERVIEKKQQSEIPQWAFRALQIKRNTI